MEQHNEGDEEQAEHEHGGRATVHRREPDGAARVSHRTRVCCGRGARDEIAACIARVQAACRRAGAQSSRGEFLEAVLWQSAHLQTRRIVGVEAQDASALAAAGWPAARRRLAHRAAARDGAASSRAPTGAAGALCDCSTTSCVRLHRARSKRGKRGRLSGAGHHEHSGPLVASGQSGALHVEALTHHFSFDVSRRFRTRMRLNLAARLGLFFFTCRTAPSAPVLSFSCLPYLSRTVLSVEKKTLSTLRPREIACRSQTHTHARPCSLSFSHTGNARAHDASPSHSAISSSGPPMSLKFAKAEPPPSS